MISHIYPVDYSSSPSCFAVARLSGLFQEHAGSCLTRKNSNADLKFQFKNNSYWSWKFYFEEHGGERVKQNRNVKREMIESKASEAE